MIIDKYAHISGFKNENPYLKVVFTILSLIVCLFSKNILVYFILIFSIFLLLKYKGQIPVAYLLKLQVLPFTFILPSTFAIMLNFSKNIPIEHSYIKIFSSYVFLSNIEESLKLSIRVIASVNCLYFLILTTTLREIIFILEKIKLPYPIIEQIFFIYRFIFLFLETASTKLKSIRCRYGYKYRKNYINSNMQLLSAIFIQTFMRSENIYNAMLSKGYNNKIKTIITLKPISASNVFIIFFFETTLIILNFL